MSSKVELLTKERDRARRDLKNKLEEAEDNFKEQLAAKDHEIDQLKAAKGLDATKKLELI